MPENIGSAAQETPVAAAADSGTESHSEDDEYVDDLPLPKGGKSREGVSAEAFGTWNKKETFKARVFEKTPQQSAAIVDKLTNSFMFQALGD